MIDTQHNTSSKRRPRVQLERDWPSLREQPPSSPFQSVLSMCAFVCVCVSSSLPQMHMVAPHSYPHPACAGSFQRWAVQNIKLNESCDRVEVPSERFAEEGPESECANNTKRCADGSELNESGTGLKRCPSALHSAVWIHSSHLNAHIETSR